MPAIDALCLLNALGLYLSPFVIDHDEMQAHCFKETRELRPPAHSAERFPLERRRERQPARIASSRWLRSAIARAARTNRSAGKSLTR